MACLSVCWRFISRWDLERHGIYMMSQLTTLLYFEAFDGDSPKKKKKTPNKKEICSKIYE